mgnify:CR=1 FL=1
MWVDIDKEGQIYLYTDSNNYMYLDNKDLIPGNWFFKKAGPEKCIVVSLEEYQQLEAKLLEYKIKELGINEASNIEMKD